MISTCSQEFGEDLYLKNFRGALLWGLFSGLLWKKPWIRVKFSGNIFAQKIQAAVFPLFLQSFSLAKKSTSQNDDRFEESGRVHCVVLTRRVSKHRHQNWHKNSVNDLCSPNWKSNLTMKTTTKTGKGFLKVIPKLLQFTADIFTPNWIKTASLWTGSRWDPWEEPEPETQTTPTWTTTGAVSLGIFEDPWGQLP